MQHKGGPRLLLTDREGALYLERARVDVEGDRVVYHITDDEMQRHFNIPHVNLAVLFLGQGTSISQPAMRLLAEEGVHVAVTGSGGSPLHMGSLTTYSATRHFRALLPIYLDPALSLRAAKAVMRDRTERMRKLGGAGAQKHLRQRETLGLVKLCASFEGNLARAEDVQQLLGFEGQFSKACYAEFSRYAGLGQEEPFKRAAGAGAKAQDPVARVNRLIDHGNYLCYGMAGAALWALGIPPHMSVFHGKIRLEQPRLATACLLEDLTALGWAALTHGAREMTEDDRKALLRCVIPSFESGEEQQLTYTELTGFTRGTARHLSAPFGKYV